jgi:hypothetical protein
MGPGINNDQLIKSLLKDRTSPLINDCEEAFKAFDDKVNELMNLMNIGWAAGGEEFCEETDEKRSARIVISGGQVLVLNQERSSSSNERCGSEILVYPKEGEDFQYNIIVRNRNLLESLVSNSYLDPDLEYSAHHQPWSFIPGSESDSSIMNPEILERAKRTILHFTSVLGVLVDNTLTDRTNGRSLNV